MTALRRRLAAVPPEMSSNAGSVGAPIGAERSLTAVSINCVAAAVGAAAAKAFAAPPIGFAPRCAAAQAGARMCQEHFAGISCDFTLARGLAADVGEAVAGALASAAAGGVRPDHSFMVSTVRSITSRGLAAEDCRNHDGPSGAMQAACNEFILGAGIPRTPQLIFSGPPPPMRLAIDVAAAAASRGRSPYSAVDASRHLVAAIRLRESPVASSAASAAAPFDRNRASAAALGAFTQWSDARARAHAESAELEREVFGPRPACGLCRPPAASGPRGPAAPRPRGPAAPRPQQAAAAADDDEEWGDWEASGPLPDRVVNER